MAVVPWGLATATSWPVAVTSLMGPLRRATAAEMQTWPQPQTPVAVRRQLALAGDVLTFADESLALPARNVYQDYVHLRDDAAKIRHKLAKNIRLIQPPERCFRIFL